MFEYIPGDVLQANLVEHKGRANFTSEVIYTVMARRLLELPLS
jgi:hypothetical protein